MSKLTLSVDSEVVSRAKRYAKQYGVSWHNTEPPHSGIGLLTPEVLH